MVHFNCDGNTKMQTTQTQPRRLKECVPKNSPTYRLSNKGKKYPGFCLHHTERSLQGPPPPHLGASDHITVMLMPAYRPLVKLSNQYTNQHRLLLRCQQSQRVDYPQWMSNGHERNKEQSVTPVLLVYLKRFNGNNQIHCVHINHQINQRNAKKTSI